MNQHHLPQHRARGTNWYFLGFLAIAGYFLLTEHKAHIVPYLPFLLLLACPLMHVLMHRGHGHGGHEHGERGAPGDCCGHRHSSERNTLEDNHEHGSVPDDRTKRPDRPA
ncbi:DUF2933 domain-containing protein [Pseudomonas sp. RC2C2]|uniref:DUF2933 domain-containing protein n=1 Tax=Pseudomonas sp. RC2C2 TaxID=2834408 RepID=UPI001BCD90BC|nr:DUF2933 domain-containing protein [Pseudomonas sp. RC2C2]MBS7600867.1 DUF2933 domain-containing protein [Pseudomonas sp. RC2C2]